MALKIFLDIETLPPEEAARSVIEEKVRWEASRDGMTLGDEEMRAEVERRFRDMALRGEAGRVLAIGIIMERDEEILHQGLLGRERETGAFHLDEARTLRAFWRMLEGFDTRRDLVIGHNVFEFDLLFLYQRSIIHRVRPSVNLPFVRYRSQPIFDTMKEWERWGMRRISLGALAEALGLENSKSQGLDGSQVYDYFRNGRCDEIVDYCRRDVELVRAVYNRLNFVN